MQEIICTEYDGFNGDSTFWTATLNNGLVVYQDDGREIYEESSSWLRLIEYCKKNSVYLTGFQIQFRDHIERLPDNALGYFFSKGVSATWGVERTFNQFITGYIDEGQVKIKKWLVPELIVMENTTRTISACEHLMIFRDDYVK